MTPTRHMKRLSPLQLFVMRWPGTCIGLVLAAFLLTAQSCAAVAPIAESALQAVGPVLWDALTHEIKRKFGPDNEPDAATAECYPHDGSALEDYPEEFGDRGWVICFVDRVKN